jgi:RNA polymerase sigma factor (TIGR02999 family)
VPTPLVYDELKRLARSKRRGEMHESDVQTTALVHEAFLRLSGGQLPECENRSHFFGIAARVMRQILVDLARTRQAQKRGPGLEIPFADLPDGDVGEEDQAFLALDQALERLSKQSELKCRLIELRFFCGFTNEEVAAITELPMATVKKELRLARAWLTRELA